MSVLISFEFQQLMGCAIQTLPLHASTRVRALQKINLTRVVNGGCAGLHPFNTKQNKKKNPRKIRNPPRPTASPYLKPGGYGDFKPDNR
jgi:hypothetical protein